MDPLDAIPYVPGPSPPQDGNRAQNFVAGVVAFGLPMVALVLLTVTELSKRPDVAMLWMPVYFTGFGLVVCVLARLGPLRTLVTCLACLWWCVLAGFTLVLADILIFPF